MPHYLVKVSFLSLLLLANLPVFAATVITAGVLPVSQYTRITIESDQAIAHSIIILKNPDRVVLDLKNVPINQSLKALTSKVLPDDFYIKKLRVANFKQGITRIVVDLKAAAKPKMSSYQPIGDYRHRLALDIYPVQDPLEQAEEEASSIIKAEGNIEDATASTSNSSGAKIILETIPALEMEEDAEVSVEPY